MSDQGVKAERAEVRGLRDAVARYAGELRAVMAAVRRDVDLLGRSTQQAVDDRTKVFDRAIVEFRQTVAMAARAESDPNSDPVVAQARARADAARRALDRARRAAVLAAEAHANLVGVAQKLEPMVEGESSVVAVTLAALDEKLHEITGDGVLAGVRQAAAVAGVFAETLTLIHGGAAVVGNASQGAVPSAEHYATLSEMQDAQVQNDHELWAENEKHRRSGERSGEER